MKMKMPKINYLGKPIFVSKDTTKCYQTYFKEPNFKV